MTGVVETLGSLGQGFAVALQPVNLVYCFLGALAGTLVGVLPGIGAGTAISILLPTTLLLDPVAGLIMLAGICYGSMYGGSLTAILVNIPGELASVVTCLDGYEMARKGRAGPALGMAAFGSFVAGTVSILGLVAFAPTFARFALKFGPPEYFALMVVSMTMVAFLARSSMPKAMIMGAFGLMVGTVGMDTISGEPRFTFGLPEFFDGIGVVPIVMGFFGIGEVLDNIGAIARRDVFVTRVRGLLPTREDWRRSGWPIARGTVLGFLMGIIPGMGSAIPAFASYVLEKRLSRHPERFGSGEIEGVAGPEAANNSAVSGTFVPLLSLGIPTNVMTTMLLAALMIYGLQPGPLLMRTRPDVFWGVIASMYVGNALLLVLNLPLIPLWVQLLRIPYTYLFAWILVFVFVGAYSLNGSVTDLYVAVVFGVLGYVTRRLGYEGAPFVLGLILGPILEVALRRSLILSHGRFMVFLERPISLALLVGLAVVLAVLFRGMRSAPGGEGAGAEAPAKAWDRWTGAAWLGLALLVCVHSYRLGWGTLPSPGPGFVFLVAGGVMGALALVVVAAAMAAPSGAGPEATARAFAGVRLPKVGGLVLLMVLYAATLEVLGYLLATFLLLTLVLRGIAGKRWTVAVLVAAASVAASYVVFASWLGTRLPAGTLGLGL